MAFLLPWIGIFIGTIMLLLIDGIMDGMEEEIFSSLNKIENGYQIKGFSNDEFQSIGTYFNEVGIDFKITYSRDVVILNGDNYMFVKMIAEDIKNQNSSSGLTIGSTISNQLNLDKSDSVSIISPLDIDFSSMKIPHTKYSVDSIYSIPVINFDQKYVFTNFSTIKNSINAKKIFTVNRELSDLEINHMKDNFSNIELIYWKDSYLELISAIRLEKILYSSFAYMLILISCLGNFTITNFIITNKLKKISMLNILGIKYKEMKRRIYLIMIFLSFISTLIGFMILYIFIDSGLINPLISTLFPDDLFYDFSIRLDEIYATKILILNMLTVYFSSFVAVNLIGRKKNIEVLKGI